MHFILILLLCLLTFQPGLAETDAARSAADNHYALAKNGDEEAWAKTFNKSDYEFYLGAKQNGVRGHALEGRWRSAQRKVSKGISWRYQRTDRAEPTECKFFYERIKPDGSRDGYPVPITLKLEEGNWSVTGVTY